MVEVFFQSSFGPKVVQAENPCCTLPIENLYARAAWAEPGKNDFSDAYMDACRHSGQGAQWAGQVLDRQCKGIGYASRYPRV